MIYFILFLFWVCCLFLDVAYCLVMICSQVCGVYPSVDVLALWYVCGRKRKFDSFVVTEDYCFLVERTFRLKGVNGSCSVFGFVWL